MNTPPPGFLEGSLIKEPVYHGSPRRGLEVLVPDQGAEFGIYLTPKARYARRYAGSQGSVYKVFVNLKNPICVEGKYEISPRDITETDIRRLKSRGYDGIIVHSRDGIISEVVAFLEEQVHILTEAW